MTDVWAKWEGRVVNGAFPLRRFLGNSDHSVVFLSEYRPLDVSEAAIKLVPADPQLADGQLARWRTLRSLSHPRLLRLFDSGHCQISGHPFFFVVMEYADQTLAQVLAQRPLTTDEVRELLPSTLDALEFLHGRQLVQGQLKPENILVVGDQLKLASDTIRPAGDALPKSSKMSAYDAPEVRDGRSSTAGDTWGLGVTLIEALTQRVPEVIDAQPVSVSLPDNIAPSFANAIRRCLSSDPAMRPTLSDLRAALEPFPGRTTPQENNAHATRRAAARLDAQSVLKHPGVIAAGAVLLIVLGWLGLRGVGKHSPSTPQDASLVQAQSSTAIPSERLPQSPHTDALGDSAVPAAVSVLHRQLPAVPRSAQASIHGHFKVSVRVSVDRTGNVLAAVLQDAGPSKYFARLAVDAAKQWKFSPSNSAQVWLLQFAFSREQLTAQASPKA
jgi:TonB family protein